MKKASLPLYIRFGKIPEDGISKVHRGDDIVRGEGGLSVWDAVSDGMGRYFPVLPEDATDDTVADYFRFLLNSNSKVYLVTGTEMFLQGADREPLLMDPRIIKDISNYYRPNPNKCSKIIYNAFKLYIDSHRDDTAPDDPMMKAVKEALEEIHENIRKELNEND